MVPSWILGLAEEWGYSMRRFESKLTQISGTLGRIHEEGPVGAAIRGHGDHLPDIDLEPEVQKFHRAWLDLDVRDRKILWIAFKEPGPAKKKYLKMELPKKTYYRYRENALMKVCVDYHLYE